jgi:hypothetical protein
MAILASLGYVVDSSVTPGLVWKYPDVTLDFRNWGTAPVPVETVSGRVIELPVGVRPGGMLAGAAARAPLPLGRLCRLVAGDRARHLWLRPSWGGEDAMIRYVQKCRDEALVMMFHSTEIVAGASPYASTERDVMRIAESLRRFFDWCNGEGIEFSGLTEAVATR